jgi:L-malate glycosyltransferase
MRIAQLIPTLHSGDAIGNNALELKSLFLSFDGMESEVFYMEADSDIAHCGKGIKYLEEWLSRDQNTATILHYALPSAMNDVFKRLNAKKILVYHNITPPEFLMGYPHLQQISCLAREQLKELSDVPDIALADSEYNRRELEETGFKSTCEMPILLNYNALDQNHSPVIFKMLSGNDITNILFVGRIAPNKCQHDLIKFFSFYSHYVNSKSRLILVGKYDGFERYLQECMNLARRLNVGDVMFTGKVNQSELLAFYRASDLFLSMSEHEGFGVPLIEAMHLNLPVMAFSAAAVPFTLSGGGVVFHRKERLLLLSEVADEIVKNDELRTHILRGQQNRLEYFSKESVVRRWRKHLKVIN